MDVASFGFFFKPPSPYFVVVYLVLPSSQKGCKLYKLLGSNGFYWVLLGFTGFYWVLLDFTGIYCVFLGFTVFWTSMESIVFLGFTGF